MASKYSDLLAQLVSDIGDVPAPQVGIVFCRCLTRFMEISQAWRTRPYFDMAAATPDPVTRAALMAAYQAAQAAANADPANLALAQAAADAREAAYAPPYFTLTRPLKTAAVIGPPAVAAVYYTAIATGTRVEYRDGNASPFWRIDPATAAGGNQTLKMLPPIASLPNGRVVARLYWVPVFDSDPDVAVPDWVFERYGGVVSDWTIGDLWMKGRGRHSDRALGLKMSNDAKNDAVRICERFNREDPLPIEV